MSRTKMELHQLVDRIPDFLLEDTEHGRTVPAGEVGPLLQDVMALTKGLLAVARRVAERQAPLGNRGHGIH